MNALFAQAQNVQQLEQMQQAQLNALKEVYSTPLGLVSLAITLVSLVCFFLVVVKMFQNSQTGLGIASLLGSCVCGLGLLLAFVMGWVKNSEWGTRPIMIVWTACVVINMALGSYLGTQVNALVQQSLGR